MRAALDVLAEDAGPWAERYHSVVWRDTEPASHVHGPLRCLLQEGTGGLLDCAVYTGEILVAELTCGPAASAPAGPEVPEVPCPPDARPLAHTGVRECDSAALDALAAGEVARVFGEGFSQQHLPEDARAAPGYRRALHRVSGISLHDGKYRQGWLTASLTAGDAFGAADMLAAVFEGAAVVALHRGYHLTLPAAWVAPAEDERTTLTVRRPVAAGTVVQMGLQVRAVGLYPRPYVRVDGSLTTLAGETVTDVHGLCLVVHGKPRADSRLYRDQPPVRSVVSGGTAETNELHLAHIASGDDPDRMRRPVQDDGAARQSTVVRPRLPRGDMLMIDRGVSSHPGEGAGGRGAYSMTEYDVPADPWYCRETGSTTLPGLALMEMALQPAGLLAAVQGACAQYPDQDFVCRNLQGRLRLSQQADCRGTTLRQHVSLRSATALPGALLHTYEVKLATARGELLSGQTTHGYFTREALAAQQGQDQGQLSEPWLLTRNDAQEGVQYIDARGDHRLGTGRMALLHEVSIAPSGGVHGRGYVLCSKHVDAADWFFGQHFLHDPVMPGSAGLQMLHQALQAFALYTPLTAHLPNPTFRMAAGQDLHWSYRGQILPEHHRIQAELHLTDITVEPDRVLLQADGDLWRDGLRIYHFDNLAIEALASAPETSPA
ncbi:hypothetical protein [Streptomyces sp. A5-4]|uniref:hypothetical protein n=1 Tax=Streptomyces sp. A5-4 TaxID=3384771 RepID=UPI003DA8B87A